jgi:hypothetical protein
LFSRAVAGTAGGGSPPHRSASRSLPAHADAL